MKKKIYALLLIGALFSSCGLLNIFRNGDKKTNEVYTPQHQKKDTTEVIGRQRIHVSKPTIEDLLKSAKKGRKKKGKSRKNKVDTVARNKIDTASFFFTPRTSVAGEALPPDTITIKAGDTKIVKVIFKKD